MPVSLFLAPAGYGKTEYVLKEVRQAARGLADTPRVCLPTQLQVQAWQRRLAANGGALGVRLLTFDELYATLLNAAGERYTRLDDPVEFRLIRAVVGELDLPHYGTLGTRPGFIQVVREFIRELKGARIWPDAYLAAAGEEARLRELGLIYRRYQERLQERGWADQAGMGWLAVEALADRAPSAAADWSLLVVDGFDSFTETQLALLELLAGRAEQTLITLTGTAPATDGRSRPVHRRFEQTRERLEARLGVHGRPLPESKPPTSPALAHLEATLFEEGDRGLGIGDQSPRSSEHESTQEAGADRKQNPGPPENPFNSRPPTSQAIAMLAAPDRAGEVRAALRWLKERVVLDQMAPADTALLARDLAPYRPYILQTAAEFGVPLRLIGGLPLRQNPAVVALLDLLRLLLPATEGESGPALPRRGVVAAWRSPYFDWCVANATGETIGIGPGDAEALDAVARWGRVIGGYAQWKEALERAIALWEPETEETDDEERGRSGPLPAGVVGNEVAGKFFRFFMRLLSLQEPGTAWEHVERLEGLIGPDPDDDREATRAEPAGTDLSHLNVIGCVDAGDDTAAERDRAALFAFKRVLQGLVWAEEVAGDGHRLPFPRFFEELVGAVEAASYTPPAPAHEGILVVEASGARGVPLQAVAVLGLAEGEFPAALGEDPFLRDEDRRRLREEHGLPLQPSTESRERETFYETVTRPWDRLLLTRPRLAESGVPWPASPFWEEVARATGVAAEEVSSERVPQPDVAASLPELLASLVAHADQGAAASWVAARAGERWQQVSQAADIFGHRYQVRTPSPYDGDLSSLAIELGQRYGPDHTWSPSRLESYRNCPLSFFIGRVLALEPRPEPAEGLDARQFGNLYHRILEAVYREVPRAARTDGQALLEALPAVATPILDAAPMEEGFRATAWWEQTKAEIVENVARSLETLSALEDDFVPVAFEAGFFGADALVVNGGDDAFRLHGLIDRVDRAPDGRIRIVDYKTAGPHSYTKTALEEGEKLQLPLYALAAEKALRLGEVADGFYWHVRQAEPSRLQLADYGVEAAVETAVAHAREVVQAVRKGSFHPAPPADGCPDYCPAATFCWQYKPRSSW